jgi:hypothetical protein
MGWAKKWWWLIVLILAIAFIVGWEEERCQAQAYQCRASYTAQAQSERLSGNVSINQQAAEQQAIAAACEPNSYFCRLFSAANLPTMLLVFIGVGAIWAALRTLWAIEHQVKLQKTAMRQWIDTGNWTQGPQYTDEILTGIGIQIPIVNGTNYPMTLNSVVATLNGVEVIWNVGSEIVPKGEHTVSFAIRPEANEVLEYNQNSFILVIELLVTYADAFEETKTTTIERLYRCGPHEFEQKAKYTQPQNPN